MWSCSTIMGQNLQAPSLQPKSMMYRRNVYSMHEEQARHTKAIIVLLFSNFMPSVRCKLSTILLVCSLSSQGRDGNVKFWQLDASLASIRQQEMQINTGAFSFCRCAVAPVQVCADSLPELRTCAAPCADCLFPKHTGCLDCHYMTAGNAS